MPNGTVPALERANGTMYDDSYPTTRMLAMRHGYYPEDPKEAQLTDELMESYHDIFMKICWVHNSEGQEKATKMDEMFGAVHIYLTDIIEPLCAKSKFLVGEKVTLADFWVSGLYTNVATNKLVFAPEKWADLLSKFPNFKAYGERFTKELEFYLASRPNYPI